MKHIRGVLQFILDRHQPYGAVVLDRYSNLLMGNVAATRLLTPLVDPSLLNGTPNLLRMAFHPLGVRRYVVNWDEVSRHLMARAERELGGLKDDQTATALMQEVRAYHEPHIHDWASTPTGPTDLLLPVQIRKDELELQLFSTIMTLGTPQDVTLQELRIETFFPADLASEILLKGLA